MNRTQRKELRKTSRIYNVINLIRTLAFMLIISSSAVFAQDGSSTITQGDTNNLADKTIRSTARVNPSTLAMEFSLPLMSYPGRNGDSVPVGFSYSSKVWRMESSFTWWTVSPSGHPRYITDIQPKFAEKTAAGWSSAMTPPRIENTPPQFYDNLGNAITEHVLDGIDYDNSWQNLLDGFTQQNLMAYCGSRCTRAILLYTECSDNTCTHHYGCQSWEHQWCEVDTGGGDNPNLPEPPPPTPIYYIKRLNVTMSDGSTQEFRQDDDKHPCGTVQSICSNPDLNGTYLSVDGSGMKLEKDASGTTLYLPNGGKYKFPTSSQVVGATFANEYVDVNGNKKTFSREEDSNGIAKWRVTDTMGRIIDDAIPNNWLEQKLPNGKEQIDLDGFNGQDLSYNISWGQLKPVGCEDSTDPNCESTNTEDRALDNQSQELHFDARFFCEGSASTDLTTQGGVLFSATQVGARACNGFNVQRDSNGNVAPNASGSAVAFATRFNPTVMTKVELPNGQIYEFKYNRYGEISKIIYPTGSKEEFDYEWIRPLSGAGSAYDQTNRGVTERRVYSKGVNGYELEQKTKYEVNYNYVPGQVPAYNIKTTSSKADDVNVWGAYSVRSLSSGWSNNDFGMKDPLIGMPLETKSYDEAGQLRSRTLTGWTYEGSMAGGVSNARRDTRTDKSVSFTFEPTDTTNALATYSKTTYDDNGSTDPEFFSHLNVKKTEGYEYVAIPVGTAASITDWSTIETWFPASKLASVTETDYTYDTNYKNAGFLGLPTATFVLNTDNPDNPDNPDRNASNGVLAKTETYYDYETPPTSNNAPYGADKTYSISGSMDCTVGTNTSQCWKDPNNTFKARPTTTRLWDDDNNIWIESHTQYDIFGNGVATKDHQNREASVDFDGTYKYAYPIGTTSPAPGDGTDGTSEEFKTETSYDFMTGLVLQTKDLRVLGDSNDDLVATMEYDAYLRPTAVVAPNGARTETEYNDDPNHPEGLWVKTRSQFDTNTWNEAIAYSDSLGRAYKTRTIDSNGDVIVESKYDNMGRVTDVSNPYRLGTNASEILWVHTEYDEAGRVETVYSPVNDPENNPGDSVGTNEYGIINNVNGITGVWKVSTDASGRKSRSVTNSLGQLVRVDEATSFGGSITTDLGSIATPHQATTYKYNIKGEMVEVTQGTQKRNFLYDSLGRLIRVKQPEQEVNTAFNKTDPVTGNSEWTMRMEYDVMGKVVESEDANGTKINYSYDAADRVLSATYSDGTPTVSYKYDLIPNGKGALIETSNGVSTSKTTQIDQWGRPTEYQQITDGQTYTSKYSYNLSGALIEEEYPSGKKVKNDFDANGDVERVWGTNGASNRIYANAFNYTASGGIASMRLGNGLWETAKFNNRLQVEELGLGHSATNAGTWKVNYEFGEYDPNSQTVTGSKNTGNIARQTVSFDGLPNAFVQTYQYDSLYRLTDANEMAGSSENWSEKFTYDRYGNRDKKFRNGLEITNNALSHPSIDPNTNRFTTTGYGYDKVGNLITDAEGRNFTFDGNNKQRIVYDGNQTVGEYFYDGDGMRVKKKVYSNGTHTKTVVFVYSGGKLIEEYSTEAPPTDKKIKYMTEDHLGTPRVITDGNGAVVSRRDFMPFGEEIANNVGTRSTSSFKYSANEDDVRQKFTGYQQDSETNLDFAEARMYENRHARFTAVDPLLASGNNAAPQTFNRFIYCGNNPIACTDPTGLVGWVTHDGQMKYDSEVNSQEDADRIYGEGNASFTPDGDTYNVDGVEWTVLEGGKYKIDGELVNQTVVDQATVRGANNSGGGGPFFAFINPSPALFRFTIRPFLPRPNRNNVRGPYNRLLYNQFARTPNRYVVPPPAVGNATRMFNPNNPYMGTGIGGGLYGPPSPAGMVNAPHVRDRRGRNTNCVNCTIANDATQAGRPASAVPSGLQPPSVLTNIFGGNFRRMTRREINDALINAGEGARGAIIGSRGPNQSGHVWNGFNINGRPVFSDGQNAAGRANWSGYREFYFLLTNNPNK